MLGIAPLGTAVWDFQANAIHGNVGGESGTHRLGRFHPDGVHFVVADDAMVEIYQYNDCGAVSEPCPPCVPECSAPGAFDGCGGVCP